MADFATDFPIQGQGPQRLRKRMRKGTRSCTECKPPSSVRDSGRRRKIRCIFESDSSICAHCSARGSQCIDQREGIDNTSQVEQRKPQRPNVSSVSRQRTSFQPLQPRFILEDDLSEDDARAPTRDSSDIEAPLDRPPPLVSILDHTQDNNTKSSRSSTASGHRAKICETLRSALPSYDEITATLARDGAWWDSFRQKTHVMSQAEPVEPLLSFAARAYTSKSPAELAILAVAYGRSLGRSHSLFSLVDNLIISDFVLGATLDGMQCLILLAKTYTDIGQPRRAWFTWRKGLAIAQMTVSFFLFPSLILANIRDKGLHRVGPHIPAIRQQIWWSIYHGDRFTSMLLGLPHGFDDSFFGDSMPQTIDNGVSENWLPAFVHQCAIISGQVISYVISPGKPSFAKSMALDEQMDSISASTPESWWDIPDQLPSSKFELNTLIERLLSHFWFFHTRMYIHLPFLKPSSSSASHDVSRIACTYAARQLVRRFLALHAEVDGGSLFDCKTCDFVGFTGVVILLIGNSRSTCPDPRDLQLVAEAEAVFAAMEESGCKIAAQCRKALSSLSGHAKDGGTQEILIPYFGKVVRTELQTPRHIIPENTNARPASSNLAAVSASDMPTAWVASQGSEFTYNNEDFTTGGIWGMGGLSDDNTLMPFGLDAVSLDIDDDWGEFISTSAWNNTV
ncbi:hypothetical protein NM208_g14110 [Fusarium decemcellulare]|uniref:Uncharacterized protein n=1 Tax=Fusarium decemcellulare TaxID=57161 RepID=A0ACC1RIS3_9HYPO|nr:hypothetical protein NM208_g14110 [Fusarium decemcellulare]